MPNTSLLGVGFYTVPEAARLLGIPALNIRRWLGGYSFRQRGEVQSMPPLWQPQLPQYDGHLELGFRDLIELRFVREFMKAGLSLSIIRHCMEAARHVVGDDRPFSTRKFKTDGRTIFIEGIRESGDIQLLDLKGMQYTIKDIIVQSFKDLDIEDDAVASWRPYRGKETIVIDPERAFGQPIVSGYGIPTIVLAQAVESEGSIEQAARLYEVPAGVVKDAKAFETMLAAA
jgi:uncharacterized protein (DUF433 family)